MLSRFFSDSSLHLKLENGYTRVLKNRKTLQFFHLFSIQLSKAEMDRLARWLKKCPKLSYLHVTEFRMTPSLARSFQDCALLMHITIESSELDYDTIWGLTRSFPKLKSLFISDSPLALEKVHLLCSGLERASALESLCLWNDGINDQGLGFLADALPKMPNLTFLDVAWNPFVGAAKFATKLLSCPKLENVSVGMNNVTKADLLYMVYVFSRSPTLKRMDISNASELTKTHRSPLDVRIPASLDGYFKFAMSRRMVHDKISAMGVSNKRTLVGRFLAADGDTAIERRIVGMLMWFHN